jgi:hypothetical protein
VRILHLVRDGRDVAMSRHPLDPSKPWVSQERWVSDARAGLQVDSDPRVLLVKYEVLVGCYLLRMRRICEHIDEAGVFEFERLPESARVQTHPAWTGKIGTMNWSSMGNWKHATGDGERSVEALVRPPGATELLVQLGYLDDKPASA